MNRETPETKSSSGHKRLSVSFLVSLMVMCGKQASRLSKKLKLKPRKRTHGGDSGARQRFLWNLNSSPRPKELLTAMSNKAKTMVGRKNTGVTKPEKKPEKEEHGVWQREILMGGKCEPLDFSGVIYYDSNGRQLREVPPRSPRVSPLRNYPTRS